MPALERLYLEQWLSRSMPLSTEALSGAEAQRLSAEALSEAICRGSIWSSGYLQRLYPDWSRGSICSDNGAEAICSEISEQSEPYAGP